jgi:hypothetical protein
MPTMENTIVDGVAHQPEALKIFPFPRQSAQNWALSTSKPQWQGPSAGAVPERVTG